ncbi:MAG: cyclic nucleotide-binding domain-containing protein, partial [Pseudomonadota bacterium]
FLVDGTIQLFDENGKSETLISTDPNSKIALGRFAKKAQDMVANCPTKLVRFPWEVLEKYLIQYAPAELSSTLEVQEILSTTSSDWMVRLLQSELFALLPPNNIQRVLSSIEFIETVPEEVIITEDEQGDDFFIVDFGSFLVSKQNTKTGGEVELAQLNTGDFFGEEALITGAPRGATVTATDKGRLIKINNSTFKDCIVAPIVPLLSADHAKSLVGKGAEYIDMRAPEQFAEGAIPDSAHLMLNILRSGDTSLDRQRTYVVVHETPTAAAHAAFLLRLKGYDAHCLNLPLEKYAVLQGINLGMGDYEGLDNAVESNSTEDLEETRISNVSQSPADADSTNSVTFAKISELSLEHNDYPTEAAEAADYAHTLTGAGLADLIEELNDSYAESSAAKEDTTVPTNFSSQTSTAPIDADIEETPRAKESDGYDIEYFDDNVDLGDEDGAASDKTDLSEETRRALEDQFAQLTAEYDKKLYQQRQTARHAIREYKIKLAKEYRIKQLALLENGKKLIALANKVSQQKAEIQRARIELTGNPSLVRLNDYKEERNKPSEEQSVQITDETTANQSNDNWSHFLKTAKQ